MPVELQGIYSGAKVGCRVISFPMISSSVSQRATMRVNQTVTLNPIPSPHPNDTLSNAIHKLQPSWALLRVGLSFLFYLESTCPKELSESSFFDRNGILHICMLLQSLAEDYLYSHRRTQIISRNISIKPHSKLPSLAPTVSDSSISLSSCLNTQEPALAP